MDDQVGAIADLNSIVLSKKFVQFSDHAVKYMTKMQAENINTYQFPRIEHNQTMQGATHLSQPPWLRINRPDCSKCYHDYAKSGTRNQMYDMAGHITRLFLHQVYLEPEKPISCI